MEIKEIITGIRQDPELRTQDMFPGESATK